MPLETSPDPLAVEQRLVVSKRRRRPADCPIGLFLSDNETLCLKTEYGSNEGRIDAYIVSSGEFFWGSAPQTIENQRRQMVRPARFEASLTRPTDVREAIEACAEF